MSDLTKIQTSRLKTEEVMLISDNQDIDGNKNFTGTLTLNGKNVLASNAISNTELEYLDGVTSSIQTQLNGKQATLTSGTNIKTINSTSLLGSGNISIASSPISALCTTIATTSSTASSTKPAVVVQNYRNGNSWYRVWSDGWIEQGSKYFGAGNGTVITLVKGFRDTSYTLVTCAGNNTNTDKHEGYVNLYNRTTTNFKIWWTMATSNCIDWYACGY